MCQNKITLMYQYFLYNADKYQEQKRVALTELKTSKHISADDLVRIHRAVLLSDMFEDIANDVFNLLKF